MERATADATAKHAGAITMNLGPKRLPQPPTPVTTTTHPALASAIAAACPRDIGKRIVSVAIDAPNAQYLVTLESASGHSMLNVASKQFEQHQDGFNWDGVPDVTHVQWGADILREHGASKTTAPDARLIAQSLARCASCGGGPAVQVRAWDGRIACACGYSSTHESGQEAATAWNLMMRDMASVAERAGLPIASDGAGQRVVTAIDHEKCTITIGSPFVEHFSAGDPVRIDSADCTSTLEAAARAKEPQPTLSAFPRQPSRLGRTARDIRCKVTVYCDQGED
jgi:hypothetical protein